MHSKRFLNGGKQICIPPFKNYLNLDKKVIKTLLKRE